MDKIARIRQEIERRIDILTNVYAEQVERKDEEMMNYYHGKVIALEELRPFLDTLSGEPDKSLEEEYKDYVENDPVYSKLVNGIAGLGIARHFAEWQKQQDLAEMAQSKSPLSVAYTNRCFENGKQAMKEQILKEAVEGYVTFNYDAQKEELPCATVIANEKPLEFYESRGFKLGDKVKLVIIKNDGKSD